MRDIGRSDHGRSRVHMCRDVIRLHGKNFFALMICPTQLRNWGKKSVAKYYLLLLHKILTRRRRHLTLLVATLMQKCMSFIATNGRIGKFRSVYNYMYLLNCKLLSIFLQTRKIMDKDKNKIVDREKKK